MTKDQGISIKLAAFSLGLKEYEAYRIIKATKGLKQQEYREMMSLRERLNRETGKFSPLVTELTGKEKIKTVGKGDEYSYDMWAAALRIEFNKTALNALRICIDYTDRAIGKLESDIEMGIRDKQGKLTKIEKIPLSNTAQPKAFIAHGGDSPALSKLKQFLEALGVQPLVVEEQASEDRSVGENVDWYSKQADCAIILATKGDIDGKTGGFIPRGNVLMEVGKLQEMFRGRIIYLLQSGTKFPTNVNEKVWGRFSPQSMDGAFTKTARELRAFGILKAVKPQNEGPSSSGEVAPVAKLI